MEPIDAIEAWELPYHLGCVVKYIARHRHKGGVIDLRKAKWYLERYIEVESMKNADYEDQALRTENTDYDEIGIRAKAFARVLHAACGIASESGELMDNVKACMFYGRNLDKRNVVEECGDLLWYIAVALDAVDSSIDRAMEANIQKLNNRYQGGGFSSDRAIERVDK